jgi:hypothetical protein
LQGDKECACLVYEKAISAEREKEHSQLLPTLLIQYSRFLFLVGLYQKFSSDYQNMKKNLVLHASLKLI